MGRALQCVRKTGLLEPLPRTSLAMLDLAYLAIMTPCQDRVLQFEATEPIPASIWPDATSPTLPHAQAKPSLERHSLPPQTIFGRHYRDARCYMAQPNIGFGPELARAPERWDVNVASRDACRGRRAQHRNAGWPG